MEYTDITTGQCKIRYGENKEDNSLDISIVDQYGNHNPCFSIKVDDGIVTIEVFENYADATTIYEFDIEKNYEDDDYDEELDEELD